MKRNTTLLGHLSGLGAYAIFGINIIVCKELTNSGQISPMGLFCIRAVGGAALFWLLSLFLPRQKVAPRDFVLIVAASLLGLFLTQLSFLEAIAFITPLDTSILAALTPVFTMFLAALFLKEPISWKKAGGVALSFAGVMLLIFNSVSMAHGAQETQPLGVVLMFANCFCFALYLTLFKPLIAKYSVVTFMKWMFLASAIMSLPFRGRELLHVPYAALGPSLLGELGFLVFFSTFVAYFLVPVGQKYLRPTVLSMYTYLQPIIASVMSIYLGMDVLTWKKAVAALAVLAGVMLVNRSRAAQPSTVVVKRGSPS